MDQKSIEAIYEKFDTPRHIIAHMQKVAYVCEKIADMMLEKRIKIDKELVITAALLHDTMRIMPHHEAAMAKFLSNQGEKKLATLVKKHGFFSIDDLKTWEEKILYYADKRVDHDQIVGLKKRFLEGRRRIGDPVTEEDFLRLDRRDQGEGEPPDGQQVAKCLELIDSGNMVRNNGTLDQLRTWVRAWYGTLAHRHGLPMRK